MTELYPHWIAHQSWLMSGFPGAQPSPTAMARLLRTLGKSVDGRNAGQFIDEWRLGRAGVSASVPAFSDAFQPKLLCIHLQ